MSLVYEELTATIIGAFYDVYNTLGYGFLEGVYENALMIELEKIGLQAEQQVPIKVFYDKKNIGNFFADILVENSVILELKAVSDITTSHEAQLLNYLKGSDMEVGLLLNFGTSPRVIRKIFQDKNI